MIRWLIAVAVAVLAPCAAPSRLAAEPLIATPLSAESVSRRDGGEVRIEVDEVRTTAQGISFGVRIDLVDDSDLAQVLAKGSAGVDSADLAFVVIRGEAGPETLLPASTPSLDEWFARSAGPLCKGIWGRGLWEYRPDHWAAISVWRQSGRGREPWGDGGNWSCGNDTCSGDVFGECDVFAIGGCGGPDCLTVCRDHDCNVETIPSTCQAYEVPFGIDLCICI